MAAVLSIWYLFVAVVVVLSVSALVYCSLHGVVLAEEQQYCN